MYSSYSIYNNAPLTPVWQVGYGPKEYGQYLLNKRNYSHKRINK